MDSGTPYVQDHGRAQVAGSRFCRFPQEDESGWVFGCNDNISQEIDEYELRQETLAWCFHMDVDNFFCMTMQRLLHKSMYFFQIYVSLKF